jgi:hypothetical protein
MIFSTNPRVVISMIVRFNSENNVYQRVSAYFCKYHINCHTNIINCGIIYITYFRY